MTATRRPLRARAVAVLVAVLTLAAACSSGGGAEATDDGSVFQGREMPDVTPKPEFTLTDTEGNPYDFAAETEGQITYLYFGYTHCPDICPVHMSQLAEVLDSPDAPPNVTVVMVTVDPERDTPEVLRAFLDKFDSRFVGLTGTPEELAVAQEAAGVMVGGPVESERAADPETYTVQHAGQVIAYAPNGFNYTQYPFPTRQSEFAHDMPILAALRTADDVPARG